MFASKLSMLLSEIAWKETPGLLQCRLKNMAREFVSFHKAIQTLARIVAVKGNDSIEIQLAELALQNLNLDLREPFQN
jgi:hypothetical protein